MTNYILVVGLGSMGKRRIRNLQALGRNNILGFDTRPDRVTEAAEKYNVRCVTSWSEVLQAGSFEAMIISVPPDLHHVYMKKAIELKTPFFVEASVVDTDMTEIISTVRKQKLFAAPSSTLYFHPAIKKIAQLVRENYLGKISNVLYHMGNYLPDWHQYEKVADFYVSKKETGGAREIVPFELTWMTQVFGFPQSVVSTVKKTIDIEGAPEIDDTYNSLLVYPGFTIVLTVDVVTRNATRRLLINGAEKQLEWDWNQDHVKVFHHDKQEWEYFSYETAAAEAGYNKNITEQMYIDEVDCFFKGIENPAVYVNSLESDLAVLRLLYSLEKSWQQQKFVSLT